MRIELPNPTRRSFAAGLVVLALGATACEDEPAAPLVDEGQCTTEITAANDGSFVELCEVISGPVRHVRIENFTAPPVHASVQVVFGFDAPPFTAQDALADDQFRVLFYGGGTPAPPATVQASHGSVDAPLDGSAAFINAGATVCFDLYDGSASTAPSFILWVDGQNGADCDTPSTLTGESAFGARAYWNGQTGAISKDTKIYFRQSAGTGATPTVTLFADAVLDEAAIADATLCTTDWATNSEWQELCTPAGVARHVRVETVATSANNSYWYTILGEAAGPTGNPVQSAGKLIVTGGQSNSGASWTWFRFDDGSTTQYNYATDTPEALYTETAATVCFDTGSNDDGTARFVFWATGANGANCDDRSTLTLANALYDSTTDPSTSGIWDVPYAAGLSFVKTNSPSVTIGEVVVSSEPAVL